MHHHQGTTSGNPLRVLLTALLLTLSLGAAASVTPITNRDQFTSKRVSSNTAPLINSSLDAVTGGVKGVVLIAAPQEIGSERNWTARFSGNELTMAGLSDFTIEFQEPASAFGLDIEDPAANSVFAIELYRAEREIGRHIFAPASMKWPGATAYDDYFIGVDSHRLFDRAVIKEIHGRGGSDREYFGQIYSKSDFRRELEDNTQALLCQIPLGIVHNFFYGAALIPSPFSEAFDAIVFGSNLLLKSCKGYLEPPPDILAYPDLDPSGPKGYACFRSFEQERVMLEYTNVLGVTIDYDYNWGELGTPLAYHHNSDSDIRVQVPGDPRPPYVTNFNISDLLRETFGAAAIYEGCREDGTRELSLFDPPYECPKANDRKVFLDVGHNTLVWTADTKIGLLDLIPVPVPGLPDGTKNKFLKELAINVVAEILLTTIDVAVLNGWRFGNAHDEFQSVDIYDVVEPEISLNPAAAEDYNEDGTVSAADVLNVVIEADDIGGVSRRAKENLLRAMFDPSDHCGNTVSFGPTYPTAELRTFWPVDNDNSFEVTWTAKDPGPNESLERNVTTLIQRVKVQDTTPPEITPPPDVVVLSDGAVDEADINLGQPLVFDIVDLNPTITNNATFPLQPGVHMITWTATDFSGQSATADQLVNIKTSNVEPVALDRMGDDRPHAISFEPVDIRIEALDDDDDPLTFFVEDYPADGFFVAPLYPYYIEDYRLQAEFTDDFLRDEWCTRSENMGIFSDLPAPRSLEYFAATDRGKTYVVDNGLIECPTPGQVRTNRRIALFDEEGVFVTSISITSGGVDDLYVDKRTTEVYTTIRNGSGSGGGTVTRYDEDLNQISTFKLESIPNFPGNNIQSPTSSVFDSNGILFVLNQRGFVYALDARNPSEGTNRPPYLGTVFGEGVSNSDSFTSMAIDTEDNLYVALGNRIFKIAASQVSESGDVMLGRLVGWMGKCDIDLAPGDQAVCDLANQRSIGYSCTNETCSTVLNSNLGISGDQPGQFNDTRGIAIDPNNNLYVTDFLNERIQRFSPGGFFAGQAESACEGSCFVLGGFGRPHDIAVNSDHFFIVDPTTNLLHVSQLSPFKEIGWEPGSNRSYAVLEYSSNNDFACSISSDCIDVFSFSASDGLRDDETGQMVRSAPALVEVEVSRNFRPPFATPFIASTVLEDVATPITLDGSELDPLDSLAFNISRQPDNGTVQVSGNTATYLSDQDYVGDDSFEFTVSDGFSTSAPEAVAITVQNVNDAAVIDLPDSLTLGRGFAYTLDASFTDPDPTDKHQVTVNWGDGSAPELEGEILSDGTITGPILTQGAPGSGVVSRRHIYNSNGNFSLQVCLADNVTVDEDGNKIPDPATSILSCATTNVNVADRVDVAVESRESADPVVPGQSLTIEIDVVNLAPDAGAGLSATGVSLQMDLDPALNFVTSIPSCDLAGTSLSCNLPDLSPGATQTVSIVTQVDANTRPGAQLVTRSEVFLNEPDQSERNETVDTTSVVNSADFFVGTSGDAVLDEMDFSVGDGICETESGNGVCSLRAVVMETNARVGLDVVALGSGVYNLTNDSPSSPEDTWGALNVEDNLIIRGNGADKTFIDANDLFRIFEVSPGVTFQLEGVTLSRGLSDSTGGAIFAQAGSDVTLRFVHVTSNGASFGAGIYSEGNVTIEGALFDGNRADSGGGAMRLLENSVIRNSTITGNAAADGSGGGILLSDGDHALTNLTVVANTASDSGGGVRVDGGTAMLANTILADNSGGDGGDDCSGSIESLGVNIVRDIAGCSIALDNLDKVGVDPKLKSIALNGGATGTMALRSESPAIDAGANQYCSGTDQRGALRTQDGDGDNLAQCDIGAFEADFVGKFDRIFAETFE